jgi:hypothetical protein
MNPMMLAFWFFLGVAGSLIFYNLIAPDRTHHERVIEDYRARCRSLGGQPLTGSDFVLCFKKDALIYVPPRKE